MDQASIAGEAEADAEAERIANAERSRHIATALDVFTSTLDDANATRAERIAAASGLLQWYGFRAISFQLADLEVSPPRNGESAIT